jgi:hypothetical protein
LFILLPFPTPRFFFFFASFYSILFSMMHQSQELAYGERGAGRDLPGGSALIFTLEMIKVKGASRNL